MRYCAKQQSKVKEQEAQQLNRKALYIYTLFQCLYQHLAIILRLTWINANLSFKSNIHYIFVY